MTDLQDSKREPRWSRKLREAHEDGRPWGRPTDYEPWIFAYGQAAIIAALVVVLMAWAAWELLA